MFNTNFEPKSSIGPEEIRENKQIVTNLMITNLKSAFEASENIFYNHRKWTTWQNMAEKYIERVENLKNQTVSLIKKKQSDIA